MEEHDGGLSPLSTSLLSVLDYILKGFFALLESSVCFADTFYLAARELVG